MPLSFDGAGIITGLQVGGLPDGTVDLDTLAASSVNNAKLAAGTPNTAALPAGTILQVQSVAKDTQFSTTSTTYVDVTDLSVSITPSSSSNTILVIAQIQTGTNNNGSDNFIRILRGASHTVCNDFLTRQGSVSDAYNYVFLREDNPGTTDEVTYKIQARVEASTIRINTRNNADQTTGSSCIILAEIAG